MLRAFVEHLRRPVLDLDGFWQFKFLGEVEPDAVKVRSIVYDDVMSVPMSFDATPKYAGLRGLVAYRKTVTLDRAGGAKLIFGSVHHWCRVFVNGKAVRDHVGGFTRFEITLDRLPAGENEIVVLVDNRFNFERCPLHLDYADWYHHGGITRGVELHLLPAAFIDRAQVDVVDLHARKLRLRITAASAKGGDVPLTVTVGSKTVISKKIAMKPGSQLLSFEFALKGAAFWSAESPNLHTMQISFGDDDLIERFGIRQVEVKGQNVQVNGQALRLLGFNRHEAHPEFGHSVPKGLMLADLQILKKMNCNFIRGSHYPQDQMFLDLCDELGFYVWVENTGWQYNENHLSNPAFMRAALENTSEMVAASYNRPSVIMWGIFNESDSDKEKAKPGYAAAMKRIKELDATRPTTYATYKWENDICLDLCDIVSLNIYPGWYWSELAEVPGHINKILAHVETRGAKNKPVIISEVGGDAMPGHSDWFGDRWSEDYQSKLLRSVIETLFVTGRRTCGLAIWQYCDMRSTEAIPRILGKPHGFNRKGVVDEYRKPKEAFYVVRDLFAKLKK